METPSYWELYPPEILRQFLMELSLNDLFNVCRTEKRVYDICQDDIFWRMKYKQDYGDIVLNETNWRMEYIIKHDYDLLTNLPFEELLETCNKPRFKEICSRDFFWKSKIQHDLTTDLPILTETNWKTQYVADMRRSLFPQREQSSWEAEMNLMLRSASRTTQYEWKDIWG